MTQTKRNYRATFILDNRGKEDSIDQIIDSVKQEITAVQGEIASVENLGKKDFARTTDRKFPHGTYVQVSFSAPAEGPTQLRERLRLNQNVYRTFVEAV
ncbi:MAG TPA: 30S ribosomal protein S6 [Opitutaceae bacterium]|nr:30S ribosomal protein S6 [Opitutaceae bacterium]